MDRYAKRMTIEQRLAESIRSFHLTPWPRPSPSTSDTTLSVAAQLACDRLRRRLPGYETATPDTIWRRFDSTKGSVTLGPEEVVVSASTYSPVLRAADLPVVAVPWRGAADFGSSCRPAGETRGHFAVRESELGAGSGRCTREV